MVCRADKSIKCIFKITFSSAVSSRKAPARFFILNLREAEEWSSFHRKTKTEWPSENMAGNWQVMWCALETAEASIFSLTTLSTPPLPRYLFTLMHRWHCYTCLMDSAEYSECKFKLAAAFSLDLCSSLTLAVAHYKDITEWRRQGEGGFLMQEPVEAPIKKNGSRRVAGTVFRSCWSSLEQGSGHLNTSSLIITCVWCLFIWTSCSSCVESQWD